MLTIFTTALLLSTPKPNLVVALMPYWTALVSLKSSTITSLRRSIMPAMSLSIT